jgi:hypothetical protein
MDIPKQDIIIVIFLLGIIFILRQINNKKEKFSSTPALGTQFNALVDNLENGVIPNDLKITGILNVKGNIFFHNYVLNNGWTGEAIAPKINDPAIRPFITGMQEQTAVMIGGSNKNNYPFL